MRPCLSESLWISPKAVPVASSVTTSIVNKLTFSERSITLVEAEVERCRVLKSEMRLVT